MYDSPVAYSVRGHPGVGSCPECMNEVKPLFTFLSIYIKESG